MCARGAAWRVGGGWVAAAPRPLSALFTADRATMCAIDAAGHPPGEGCRIRGPQEWLGCTPWHDGCLPWERRAEPRSQLKLAARLTAWRHDRRPLCQLACTMSMMQNEVCVRRRRRRGQTCHLSRTPPTPSPRSAASIARGHGMTPVASAFTLALPFPSPEHRVRPPSTHPHSHRNLVPAPLPLPASPPSKPCLTGLNPNNPNPSPKPNPNPNLTPPTGLHPDSLRQLLCQRDGGRQANQPGAVGHGGAGGL